MRRTFIAIRIDPDEELKLLLGKIKAGLSDSRIKWVETYNLHITLAFLGDTTERDISTTRQVLESACSKQRIFRIVFQNIGLFRSLKDPRVIWLGTDQSPGLADLRESICSELIDRAIYNDTRPFRPHLTLGRPKYIKETDYLEGLIANTRNRVIQESHIDKVVFFESILRQQGPVYRVLGEYLLS